MSGSVREIDHGYNKLRAALKNLKGSYVKVGIQQGAKHDDREGVSDLVLIAASQEFGVRAEDGTWKIPPRSFIGAAYEKNKENLAKHMAAEKSAILTGKKTPRQSLDAIGLLHAGQIVAVIDSHPPPPNAPSTIAQKHSSGTLVDSGQMKQSIRHVTHVEGEGGKE